MSTLSERLLFAMQKKNIKQADLVRATGVSRPSVHAWVSGATKNLKGENLVKIASYLGVSTDWLAYGVGNMDSCWPFKKVTPEDLMLLSSETLEDIEDIIWLKVNKTKNVVYTD